jgi:hypothetical protein
MADKKKLYRVIEVAILLNASLQRTIKTDVEYDETFQDIKGTRKLNFFKKKIFAYFAHNHTFLYLKVKERILNQTDLKHTEYNIKSVNYYLKDEPIYTGIDRSFGSYEITIEKFDVVLVENNTG